MLLLVATLSITFTACGDDDDEPDKSLTNSFLIGTWVGSEYDSSGGWYYNEVLTFKSDGTFTLIDNHYKNISGTRNTEFRGSWRLNKDILHLKGSWYEGGTFVKKLEKDCEILFDEYTQRLVFTNAAPYAIKQFSRKID